MGEPTPARPAVVAAQAGSQWWDLATRTQRARRPGVLDHGEFYELAAELVATLRAVQDMAGALARQSAGYGEHRALRDDEGADPIQRLADATGHADDLHAALAAALRPAHAYWSEISHVGLAYPPDELDRTTDPDTCSEGSRS